MYVEAIQEAKKGNINEAEKLVKEGAKIYVEGHHAHGSLIQQEANGE